MHKNRRLKMTGEASVQHNVIVITVPATLQRIARPEINCGDGRGLRGICARRVKNVAAGSAHNVDRSGKLSSGSRMWISRGRGGQTDTPGPVIRI